MSTPDLSWLKAELTLAFDTETTGIEETDRPFGISFATANREEFYDERVYPNLWSILQNSGLFKEQGRTWIAQNFKFDQRMIGYMGLNIAGTCVDITSLARLVRNDHMLYSLDAQAQRELGKSKDKTVDEYIKKNGLYETRKNFFGEDYKSPQFHKVPQEIMHNYAKMDARLTYDLYINYTNKLAAANAEAIKNGETPSHEVIQQESDLIKVCYKMERRGLLLNKSYTLEAMYAETASKKTLEDEYEGITKTKFVDSAKSIQKNLAIQLPTTEKGNPSLDDDAIDFVIANGNERDKWIAETVRSIRGYDKRISTYYKGYLNSMTKESIIHPTMWIAGTRTGRFSYSDPNFQNMPKEEDSTAAHVVRGCIKPRAGKIFVSLDYSQMEYRMAVAYANQKDVIDMVMAGADFHKATADLVGIKRSEAKTLNFAVLYGAGIDKIAGMLGILAKAASQLKFKYFAGMPKVEKLIDKIIATGRGRGYVVNWLGRRLYAHKEFCYALPNHLIQSGGADICKRAMVQIDREFPDLDMVLQVHDQLVFEMTEAELCHVPRIKEIMETVFPPMNGMTLKVDVKYNRINLAERDMKEAA